MSENNRAMEDANQAEDVPKPTVIEVERKFVFQEDTEQKILDSGGELVSQKSFTDVYYDTQDYKLTLSDYWLRERDGAWELKCPPEKREKGGRTTHYAEFDKEDQIAAVLNTVLFPGKEKLCGLAEVLKASSCQKFAQFTTDRKTYALHGYTIDLDSTDFGFQVGEIELLVVDESRIAAALTGIDELAERLGFDNDKRISGKMDAYLLKNNKEQYQKLIQAHILQG